MGKLNVVIADDNEKMVRDLEEIVSKAELCIDIICNPKQTKFLQYAKCGYNGIYMLIFQAIHAQILWGFSGDFEVDDLYKKL